MIRLSEHSQFILKGRGLFARRSIKEGEELFAEKPFVSVQFAWNEACKYLACHHCLKSLENSQEMYSRLSNKPDSVLPRMDLCEVTPEKHHSCPSCNVNMFIKLHSFTIRS